MGVASLRLYLGFKRGKFCKIENGFYSLVCFHCEYLRTQKLENFVFYLKQHVWADAVLNSGCRQFFNLLSLTEMHSV